MARYIDAEELQEEIKSLSVMLGGNNVFKTAKESVLRIIDEQPTADVVEVVRCKDCKHRHSSEFCECREETAYCSDGERIMNCKQCIHKDVCSFRNPADDEETCAYFKNEEDYAKINHAEWLRQNGGFFFLCSVCGKAAATKGNYCHSCGAKMDGGIICKT